MLQIVKNTDIFSLKTQVLVNPVNCVGVMGKGLARDFKQKFPANFDVYQRFCQEKHLTPGGILVVETELDCNAEFPCLNYIFNVATKYHWANESKIEWIEKGVLNIKEKMLDLQIKTIAIPALGCGNGGLNWSCVKAILINCLSTPRLDGCKIIIVEPISDLILI